MELTEILKGKELREVIGILHPGITKFKIIATTKLAYALNIADFFKNVSNIKNTTIGTNPTKNSIPEPSFSLYFFKKVLKRKIFFKN